jgi:hypothetical protein
MDSDFIDIKIVELVDDMTVESHDNPALRLIFLRLSQTPPPLWQKTFAESRKIPRHPRWRRAWLDRKFIIVECVPEEIETHHLRDLKQDIAQANAKFRQYVDQQNRGDYQRRETQSLERDKLRDMKSRLNFD